MKLTENICLHIIGSINFFILLLKSLLKIKIIGLSKILLKVQWIKIQSTR